MTQKLNFCPFDFSPINSENLAYELYFTDGQGWDSASDILNIDVLDEDKQYIDINDQKRSERFGADAQPTSVVILQERKSGMEKSGMEWLREKLEDNEDVQEETENDYIVFRKTENRMILMYAFPCCPYCHNRLPVEWNQAEDFMAVALMGPTGGGKTTFLYSMMHDEWDALNRIVQDRISAYISPAYHTSVSVLPDGRTIGEVRSYYDTMLTRAEKMCRTEGECPENTDKKNWIMPVFLLVRYGEDYEHSLIVGLYDNAGENLERTDWITTDQLNSLREKMYADIFLFDPEDMNVALRTQKQAQSVPVSAPCEVWNLEEQGRQQKAHRGETVLAESLLPKAEQPAPSKDIMRVYRTTRRNRSSQGQFLHMKQMHFAGVIIKSDLLRDAGEQFTEAYGVLFNPMLNWLDSDDRAGLTDATKQMINRHHLLGEEQDLGKFDADYGSTSWHCVSALGCDAETGKNLEGDYAPIRVGEPLVACILQRIRENGWE